MLSRDLLSAVIVVRPTREATLPWHLGRAVHASLLVHVKAKNPALAVELHDDKGVKPIACSTLQGIGPDSCRVTPRKTYWFRWCLLRADAAATVLVNPPSTIELDGETFHVEAVHTTPAEHPWAAATTYEDLAAPYLSRRVAAPQQVHLQFHTPTVFRQNGLEIPIPLPDLVFGSLADRWNAFAPVAEPNDVRAWARDEVRITAYDLHSQERPQKGRALVGAVGEVTYTTQHNHLYWQGVLAMLADYAFFAGVGRATAWGMGQTRRLVALGRVEAGGNHGRRG